MNNSQKLPIFFHPTTAIFIDDNEHFLETIRFELNENRMYQCFKSPSDALKGLNDNYQSSGLIHRCLNNTENDQFDHQTLDVNIRALHHEIYNPTRFDEIAVIITDYSMPEINGVELCEKIKDTRFKKILLTGEADEGIAIDAFNAGIIDQYIRKDEENYSQVLNTAILQLEHQFFVEQSDLIRNTMLHESTSTQTVIDSSHYRELLKKVCKDHHIVEYYLLDMTGSYLMLDIHGNILWLIAKTGKEMETYYQLAAYSDATPEMIASLKNREKMPHFYHSAHYDTDPEDWNPYLHPAHQLADQDIYYTIIQNRDLYQLENNALVDYNHFLSAQFK